MPLPKEEEIVKAICSDKWDDERIAPSLFTGAGTSVSRLALISLEDHWDLFRKHVQKPQERLLERIGQINVGRLHEIGVAYSPAVDLTVEAKPEEWNRAHAEIPQKITRGLANKIIAELTVHAPPASSR